MLAVRESSAKIFLNNQDTQNWNGIGTRITVPIQPFILRSDDPNHFVIGVESLSVPLAIYPVNNTNNIIQIGVDPPETIPEGNYTATSLTEALKLIYPLLTIDFSDRTNKFTFDGFASPAVFGGTAQRLLGYRSDAAKTAPYEFEGTVNLAYTTGINIRLDNIVTENRCPIEGGGSGVLARIPITVAPFKVLQYFNASPFYTTITTRAIQRIEISLLDDDYEPLVLIGNPVWSIVMRIDFTDKTAKDNQHAILDKSSRSMLINKNIPSYV
jgi:hypothetical protein